MIEWAGRGDVQEQLIRLGFNKQQFSEFREALEYSKHSTVDTFLEHKSRFRNLGAHLIAQTLLPKEQRFHLFPQKDWYAHLFDGLNFENENATFSNLSFVTLNYDRSLEHFLNRNIDYNCRDDRMDRAYEKLSQIKIVHAHGSLGEYPAVGYGEREADDAMVSQAATRIKIVSDKLTDSPEFQEAQRLVGKAENIIFLGCGYHPETIKGLFATSSPSGQRVFGTTYEMRNPPPRDLFGARDIRLGTAQQTPVSYLESLVIEPAK